MSYIVDTLIQGTAESDAVFNTRVLTYITDQQYYFEQVGGSFPVPQAGTSSYLGYPPVQPSSDTLFWDVTAAQMKRVVTFSYDDFYYYKFTATTPALPPPSPLPTVGNIAIFTVTGALSDGAIAVDTALPQFTNLVPATTAGHAVEYTQLTDLADRIKAERVTTGVVTAGTTALVTLTWALAFADANYTVTVSVQDSTADVLSLSVVHVESKTATDITVRIRNTAAIDLTGTLHAIAIHD